VGTQLGGAVGIALHLKDRRESPDNLYLEPREPDAFALAVATYFVHPVVPVAGAD
jgi:hypothetical protein